MSQADKTTAQNKTAKSYLLSIGSHVTTEKKIQQTEPKENQNLGNTAHCMTALTSEDFYQRNHIFCRKLSF